MKESIAEKFLNALSGTAEPDAVELLKTDHKIVEELFKQFEMAKTKSEMVKLIDKLVKELSIHATVEEKLIYPLLLSTEENKTNEALEEHHVVKLILAELADFDASEKNVRAKVQVLHEMVKHHVKEEESELLPKLKNLDTDLDGLAVKIQEEKKKLKGHVKKIGNKRGQQIGGSVSKRRKAS